MKNFKWNVSTCWTSVVVACILIFAGCAGIQAPSKPAAVSEISPGLLKGYLPFNALPNSLALIPPPPAAGSTALAMDEETFRKTRAFRGTPRWELATQDADLNFPEAAGTFSCAINAPITEKDTPRLYILIRRILTDAGLSTYAAKNKYKRTRPFVVYKETTCFPDEEKRWINDGSYPSPSGHASLGWAWALILSEIDPEDTNAILARGRAFGESRVVCGVHWQSDVTEGQFMGACTVARLHADPVFRADIEAAKAELAAVRAKGLKPTRDCQAEAAAMAFQPPPVK